VKSSTVTPGLSPRETNTQYSLQILFVTGNPTVNLDPRFVDPAEVLQLNLTGLSTELIIINNGITHGSDLLLTVSVNDTAACDLVSLVFLATI
jgi:hypothetical protein